MRAIMYRKFVPYIFKFKFHQSVRFNHFYDVVIIGGGVMGLSSAYFLKSKQSSLKIAVIERDVTYSKAASALSVASIRQQFSNVENIRLSQWSHNFLCDIPNVLKVDEVDPPDVCLVRGSYMLLSSEKGNDILSRNCSVQQSCQAGIKYCPTGELKKNFPWLNTEGIAAGTYCTDGREGWFDGWSLISSFQKKIKSLGVDFIEGNCHWLEVSSKVNSIDVHTDDGNKTIKGSYVLNAAGPWAGYLMDSIGVTLPVVPRKRYVFVFDCPKGPGRNMPLVVAPTGAYSRPEGNGTLYLAGCGPTEEEEPDITDLSVDYDYFYDIVWPRLAEIIPAFEELKLKHSWAGYYDYNTLDQNGIIGRHHEIDNLYFANGFSGHGIQQSPAVGNAISELILEGRFSDIDLTKLSYDRIIKNEPFRELNVI